MPPRRGVETLKTCGNSFVWLPGAPVRTPAGDHVQQKERMKYLGSLLSADGGIGPELNARLGAARSDFFKLCKIWAHTAISRRRKMEIFNACVVSKLTYCLQVA